MFNVKERPPNIIGCDSVRIGSMRYFVLSDDGGRFGPAEIATLATWVTEGRILPTTKLEEEGSGAKMAASGVSGLSFSPPPPGPSSAKGPAMSASPNNPYSASYAQNSQAPSEEGKTEVIFSWVLGGLSFVLCCVGLGWILAGIGAFLGYRAKEKGHRSGQAAMIFNIIVATIMFLIFVVGLVAGHSIGERLRDMQNQQTVPHSINGNSIK
jgi:hypothetical protein